MSGKQIKNRNIISLYYKMLKNKEIYLLALLMCCQIMLAQTNDYKITYKRFEGNLKRNAVLYVKENQPTVMHIIMASTVPIKVIKDTTYINENGATV